ALYRARELERMQERDGAIEGRLRRLAARVDEVDRPELVRRGASVLVFLPRNDAGGDEKRGEDGSGPAGAGPYHGDSLHPRTIAQSHFRALAHHQRFSDSDQWPATQLRPMRRRARSRRTETSTSAIGRRPVR